MAMLVGNNSAAMLTLGELNKNISKYGKELKKLTTGERITSAGDDASGYAISERMRVRLRALDQNEANVQTGQTLLKVAEGGIQEQIELMKTIKAKVIEADNDTNTDIDRETIQKEINHCFQQIEDIANETNYNGKRLLVGDTVSEKVLSWVVNDTSELLAGSDEMNMINVIPDVYETLNGIVGPFDLFQHSEVRSSELASIGFSPTIQFTGGGDIRYTLDSSYTTVDSFDGVAFNDYILTKTPSSTHRYGGIITDNRIIYPITPVIEIDISSCNTVQDVLATIQAEVYGVTGYGVDENGMNYLTCLSGIRPRSYSGYSATVEAVPPTGLVRERYFSGGREAEGVTDNDPDSSTYQPATNATFSLNGIAENTGITVHYLRENILSMLQFVSGSGAPASSNPPNGVISVGVDYSGTFAYGEFSVTMGDRELTIKANELGRVGNGNYVEDGISAATYEFLEVNRGLIGENIYRNACATVDVSGYSDAESLINDLKGKAITVGNETGTSMSADFGRYGYGYDYYEFVDSASDNPIDRMYKINNATVLDLDVLRGYVSEGLSIGEAFANMFVGQRRVEAANDSNGQTIGIQFAAINSGNMGNREQVFLAQGQLRSYTLDYGVWFTENSDISIPDFLNNKGFRVYCASCDNQWFNFHFVTDDLPEGPLPNADPGAEDIKQIYIDVSEVTDADSLVQAIYDQAMPQLTGDDPDLNHFMRLVADGDKLIIYDERRFTDYYLRNMRDSSGELIYEYQWDDGYGVGGAKIADGVWDNVAIGERDVYVKNLVIQHTDHANMHIRLKIPETTMNHLFGYKAGTKDWRDFNVMTAASREELLGNQAGTTRSGKYIGKEEKGLLDTAMNYLTSANCLVGAQIARLKMAESNIITQQESTAASESTIRDADMAKEMTEYAKYNVLARASQSMLAQANQNSASVLTLLQ
jgi:flagellin